ncbi:hypothetical protein SS50377_20078 [Spironucleus salmonicida]|uniref:Transmembrane protein n=1 Tax=Spironucleus salmonicida TaxID=348837 RepID=A0A9P8LZD4_9EUKA|nr:hypothetical protein SS50377_20078 [Spironucleus salmonicida]
MEGDSLIENTNNLPLQPPKPLLPNFYTDKQVVILKIIICVIFIIFIITYESLNICSSGFASPVHKVYQDYRFQFNRPQIIHNTQFPTDTMFSFDQIFNSSIYTPVYQEQYFKNIPFSLVINNTMRSLNSAEISSSNTELNTIYLYNSLRYNVYIDQPLFNKNYWNYFGNNKSVYTCGNVNIENLDIKSSLLDTTNIPIWYFNINSYQAKMHDFSLKINLQQGQCIDFLLIREYNSYKFQLNQYDFNGKIIIENLYNSTNDFEIRLINSSANNITLIKIPQTIYFNLTQSNCTYYLPFLTKNKPNNLYGVISNIPDRNGDQTLTKVKINIDYQYNEYVDIILINGPNLRWKELLNAFIIQSPEIGQLTIILNAWNCNVIDDRTNILRCIHK